MREALFSGTQKKPHVLVYKYNFLPNSETFIADHLRSLQRWKPIPIFEEKEDNSHCDLPPSFNIIGDPGRWQKIRRTLLTRHGYSPLLSRLVRQYHPQLIHAHFLTNAARIMRCAKRLRIPLVATAHGLDAAGFDEFHLSHDLGRFMVENRSELIERISAVFCVSDFIRRELLNRGFPPEKLVVQKLGVDLTVLRPERPAGEKAGVLFVGRLVEKKGATRLMQAWKLLPPHVRKQGLTIIGEGPDEYSVRKLADNCPEVKILGARSHKDVISEMRNYRILAIPSMRAKNGDSEGLPIVAMEAQAMGLPIVAFDDGPMREAIQNGTTGLAVKSGDIRAYADALEHLLISDELSSTFGSSGQKFALDNFDLSKNTKILENIYDKIIHGQPFQE